MSASSSRKPNRLSSDSHNQKNHNTMLTYKTLTAIKAAFATIPTEQQTAILTKTADEQVTTLRAFTPADIEDVSIREFVHVLRVGRKLPSTRAALGLPEARTWVDVKPGFQLRDTSTLVVRHPEEFNAILKLADTVTFDELFQNEQKQYARLANAIKVHYGLGGFEDVGDSKALPYDDRTLQVLLQTLLGALRDSVAPHWFDADGNPLKELPAGVRGESAAQVVAESEAKALAAKLEQRRERQAKIVQERKALYATRRAAVSQTLNDSPEVAQAVAVLSSATFEELKGILNEANWLSDALLANAKAAADGITAADADEKAVIEAECIEHVQQAILIRLAPLHPSWFKLLDGDVKLRPAPLKDKPKAIKKPRAIMRAMYELIEKYGSPMVNETLTEMFGVPVALPAPKARDIMLPDVAVVEDDAPAGPEDLTKAAATLV